MIDKKAGAVFYLIYHFFTELWGQCRATLAATNITLRRNIFFIYIVCTVNNDGTFGSVVVEPFFTPLEPQRVSITTLVSFTGDVKTKAAFVGGRFV